jgi:hypothetical protein
MSIASKIDTLLNFFNRRHAPKPHTVTETAWDQTGDFTMRMNGRPFMHSSHGEIVSDTDAGVSSRTDIHEVKPPPKPGGPS